MAAGDEVTCQVPLRDLERIFDLADKIAQPQVKYQRDPLRMANDVISISEAYASEIAALSGRYPRS